MECRLRRYSQALDLKQNSHLSQTRDNFQHPHELEQAEDPFVGANIHQTSWITDCRELIFFSIGSTTRGPLYDGISCKLSA